MVTGYLVSSTSVLNKDEEGERSYMLMLANVGLKKENYSCHFHLGNEMEVYEIFQQVLTYDLW